MKTFISDLEKRVLGKQLMRSQLEPTQQWISERVATNPHGLQVSIDSHGHSESERYLVEISGELTLPENESSELLSKIHHEISSLNKSQLKEDYGWMDVEFNFQDELPEHLTTSLDGVGFSAGISNKNPKNPRLMGSSRSFMYCDLNKPQFRERWNGEGMYTMASAVSLRELGIMWKHRSNPEQKAYQLIKSRVEKIKRFHSSLNTSTPLITDETAKKLLEEELSIIKGLLYSGKPEAGMQLGGYQIGSMPTITHMADFLTPTIYRLAKEHFEKDFKKEASIRSVDEYISYLTEQGYQKQDPELPDVPRISVSSDEKEMYKLNLSPDEKEQKRIHTYLFFLQSFNVDDEKTKRSVEAYRSSYINGSPEVSVRGRLISRDLATESLELPSSVSIQRMGVSYDKEDCDKSKKLGSICFFFRQGPRDLDFSMYTRIGNEEGYGSSFPLLPFQEKVTSALRLSFR